MRSSQKHALLVTSRTGMNGVACSMHASSLKAKTYQKIHAKQQHSTVWDAAIREAIKNGGVINEHHGVGLKLGRYMKDLYGNSFPILEGIKKTLDPNHIMNPGKMGL